MKVLDWKFLRLFFNQYFSFFAQMIIVTQQIQKEKKIKSLNRVKKDQKRCTKYLNIDQCWRMDIFRGLLYLSNTKSATLPIKVSKILVQFDARSSGVVYDSSWYWKFSKILLYCVHFLRPKCTKFECFKFNTTWSIYLSVSEYGVWSRSALE